MLKTSTVELGVCWTIYVENLEGDGLFHTGPSLNARDESLDLLSC